MRTIRFDDLTFDEEFLGARRDDGTTLAFTRHERALLLAFNRRRSSLLSRGQLLDALGDAAAEAGERNVDYLINRLRLKLGDNARDPRFIATQYGEGYVWIAKPHAEQPLAAFLAIGPAYGLDGESGGRPLLSALAARLDALTASGAPVLCRPEWRPGRNAADAVQYSLDASFYDDGAALHGAFVLRHGGTQQVLAAFRATFARDAVGAQVEQLAGEIKEAIWRHLAVPSESLVAPAEKPLELRMHDAALLLARSPESWLENEAQLARAGEDVARDPALALMRAMTLFSRLVLFERGGHVLTDGEWRAMEDEIEALALGSLADVGDNPLLMLAAAKLLFFIDRGHFERAEELADAAFARSTAFAAAFATQGQLRMCRGRIEEAVALYDKGIELSEPGSEFYVYVSVLKCTALLAAGNRAALDETCAKLYAAKPLTRLQLGLFLAPADQDLPADLGMVLASIDADSARRLIMFLYRVSARHFLSPVHRANVLRGLIAHATRRFGEAVVPPEISAAGLQQARPAAE